jgi:hypothetical protein
MGYHRMILTRRILLTLSGLAVLGIAIPACRKMLGQILFSPKATPVPPPPPQGNPFKNGSKSLVAMVHGTDVPAMVERAIALIGGLGKLQLAGTRTLLKPNVVGGGAPPSPPTRAWSRLWALSCGRRSQRHW